MQINWKVRFQNKTFLTGLISLVVVFIYDLLQLLEIVPTVTQSAVMQVAEGILTILGMVGAGGIGYVISNCFSRYAYGQAIVAIGEVLLFTYAMELAFTRIKEKKAVR